MCRERERERFGCLSFRLFREEGNNEAMLPYHQHGMEAEVLEEEERRDQSC